MRARCAQHHHHTGTEGLPFPDYKRSPAKPHKRQPLARSLSSPAASVKSHFALQQISVLFAGAPRRAMFASKHKKKHRAPAAKAASQRPTAPELPQKQNTHKQIVYVVCVCVCVCKINVFNAYSHQRSTSVSFCFSAIFVCFRIPNYRA